MSMGLFEIRMLFPLSQEENSLLETINKDQKFIIFGQKYRVESVRYNFSSDGFRDSVDIRAYSDEL